MKWRKKGSDNGDSLEGSNVIPVVKVKMGGSVWYLFSPIPNIVAPSIIVQQYYHDNRQVGYCDIFPGSAISSSVLR